jgi:hypothetical protein
VNILQWIGRRATGALAVGSVLGLFIPGIQSWSRDALPLLIYIFTVASFLKVDAGSFSGIREHPVRVALLLGWCLVAVPLFVQALLSWSELPGNLHEAVVIWAVSPPMAAAIVFAILLRLDVALAVTASVVGMILLPITGSPISAVLADLSVELSPNVILARVALFIGSAALIAMAIRRVAGKRTIQRYSDEISGIVVFILVIYATSMISGVRDYIFAHPWQALGFVSLAAALNAGIQVLTVAVFWRCGPMFATTAGLVTGNKNMSVIYANLGSAVSPEIMLFFAAIHVPIYSFPWLFRSFYDRVAKGQLRLGGEPGKVSLPAPQHRTGMQRGR